MENLRNNMNNHIRIEFVKWKESLFIEAIKTVVNNTEDIVAIAKECNLQRQKNGEEIFYFQNKPLLKFFPVEYERCGTKVWATQKYEKLYEQPNPKS